MYECVVNIRDTLATAHQLPQTSKAALLIENLSGRARQEILGHGAATSSNTDVIFQVLLSVFGDGNLLPQLQKRFILYLQ